MKKTSEIKKGTNKLTEIMLIPEVGILIPIFILCVVTSVLKPSFLTWKYLSAILCASVFVGVDTFGECLVIMSGEIDLSVGMCSTFAGVMMGTACVNWGWSTVPCIMAGVAAGALVGAINGFCVCRLNLSSWITTLATMYVCKGLAVTITKGIPLEISRLGLSDFARAKPLGLSWLFFIFLALIFVMDFIIRHTKFGYRVRAIGGNKEASIMAGIDVSRVKFIIFVLAGMFAGLSGVFDVINGGTANSTFGDGREFRCIICCAIGGVSMTGGSGSAFGMGLGVLMFHTLWYCLRVLCVNSSMQLVLIGIILVAAVVMDSVRNKIQMRRMV